MKARFKWLVFLLAILLIPAAAQAPATPPNVSALQEIVVQTTNTIADWEAAANAQLWLTFAAVLFGGLVTLLQPWSAKTWCKGVTAGLGLAIAIVTAVTSKAFPVDYRLYQRSALQARAKLRGMQADIAQLKAGPPPDDEKELRNDFLQRLKSIGEIESKLSGDDKLAGLLPDFAGVVHAQSDTPNWATKTPSSPNSLYFVGTAEGRSLSEAKQNSLDQAMQQSAKYVVSQSKSLDGDAAMEFAKASSSVDDTAFVFDPKKQSYRYHTLVRLDKALASAGVVDALAPQKPGIERWSIKTSIPEGSDPNRAKTIELSKLLALELPPGIARNDHRFQSSRIPRFDNPLKLSEGDMVTTTGWLWLVASEFDGDYHMQISNSSSSGDQCLVVEIPDARPAFTSSAALRPLFQTARALLKTSLLGGREPTMVGSFFPQPAYVRVTGQLFLDIAAISRAPRGKHGMKAATAWEIHPVTDIAFPQHSNR